jgi:hypothetical protein
MGLVLGDRSGVRRGPPRRPASVAIAVSALAPILVGCSLHDMAYDDEPTTTVTTAARPTVAPGSSYTVAQLGAALPPLGTLPGGFQPRFGCVNDPFPDCTVQPGQAEAYVQYVRGVGFDTTTLTVRAAASADGADAFNDLADRREEAKADEGVLSEPVQYDGRFDAIYTPGRQGTLTVTDTEVGRWGGFRVSADYDAIDEFQGRHPTRSERVVVAAGNVVLDTELIVAATTPADIAVDTVVTDMIARLP